MRRFSLLLARLPALLPALVPVLVPAALMIAPAAAHAATDAEATSQIFDGIRSDPARLGPFLRAFPKGADLHNHLVGAIYAEDFLDWAAQDGLCVQPDQGVILPHPCTADDHGMPAAALTGDAAARAKMIDALSMRDFVRTATDRSGHDHFFATFDRFMPASFAHEGDMLAAALNQAGRDHIRYVEFMISPQLIPAATLGAHLKPDTDASFTPALTAIAPGMPRIITAASRETDAMEERARQIMQCGTANASAGCSVTVRYLYQTVRTFPPGMVFAQIAFGYALTSADARFVGVNIVAPEDDAVSLRDYSLHMRMFHFLSVRHPGVKLSLHAGELAADLVRPPELRSHIRQAVEVAEAARIGHGVDVLQEEDPAGLLTELAQRHVMVEINLTSNDEILGVKGAAHPFMTYMRHGVPVALSTDDEGVSRGNLTAEYLRAARDYPLSYAQLRDLSRNGLEYAFVPGASLWQSVAPFQMKAECAGLTPASPAPADAPASGPCHDLLAGNEKARLQWALEGDFALFEHGVVANGAL